MSRRSRWILPVIAVIGAVWLGDPRAQVASSVIFGTGGTTFYGIGDLAGGGTNSIVQEATQVGSNVYAVGASTRTATNTPIANLDTAVRWDNATNVLTVVPDLVVFPDPQPTSTNSVVYAITPDAQYIGGRTRNTAMNSGLSNGYRALRLLGGLKLIPGFAALDISDNASIVYGQQSGGAGAQPGVNNSRAIRSDVSGASTVTVQVPLLTTNLAGGCVLAGTNPVPAPPQTCLDNLPAYRGMSSDGSVLVGTAFTGAFTGLQNQYLTTNGLAFRWVSGQPAVVEIPRPAGGTWSSAVAISPNGNLTLAAGNSSDFPLGEVWIQAWIDNAATGAIQKLGSPNTQFSPRLYGGMTEDGAVVGVTFMGANPTQSPTFQNNPVQYAYLHNSFGWFHLANVLAAQGVDLWANGWDPANMILTGIRSVDTDNSGTADVELVFGQGRRRHANGSAGAPEGFVVSFPVGVLSDYQLPEAVPVENALVGAWALGSDPNNPRSVAVFLADGTFYTLSSFSVALGFPPATRFERGVYTLSAGNTFTVTTTEDRDGAGPHQSELTPPPFVFNGLTSSLNGRLGLSVNFTSADTFVIEDASCTPLCSVVQATRIAGGVGSIVGGWRVDFDQPDFTGRFVLVFLDSNAGLKYFYLLDGEIEDDHDSETGTYTWNADLQSLVLTPDFGTPDPIDDATLTQDQLGLIIEDDGFTYPGKRIVNPSTVLPEITNATLEAQGTEDGAFSYTVTAVNALTFEAEGLPTGLTINPNTGVISGTPAVNGVFNINVTVTNTLGDTDAATLVLTFAAPPVSFRGIRDLAGPGGVSSAVRDATRVGGTIYAVGASTVNHLPTPPATVPTLDTPVLWTYTGTGAGALEALPYFAGATNTNTSARTAYAITPDSVYLASHAKAPDPSNSFDWVRVTRSALPNPSANANLTFVPGRPATENLAMSDSGLVSYGLGWANITSGNRVPVRYEIGLGSNAPDLTPTGKNSGFPIPRGTTSDGLVMVGAAFDGSFSNVPTPPTGLGTNTKAFRYVHTPNTLTGTTTVIPMLPGGTWNFPIALSSDGGVTVVAGDSNDFPGGEIYTTDAANTVIAVLGSPNSALIPRLLGGRTNDGVVAVTFANNTTSFGGPVIGLGIPSGGRYAYIRNSHGWFHFSSALAALGVDLVAQGWDPTNMAITGVRTVEGVDLVSGQGLRRTVNAAGNGYVNGALEGFVAELPAGALAAFNPTPTPPADQSIVGTWYVGDLATTGIVLSFMADGTYVRVSTNTAPTLPGFERGVYTWAGNAAGGALMITTLNDSDGTGGGSARNGQFGTTAIIAGDTFLFVDTNIPNATFINNTRVPSSPGSLVGGWIYGSILPDDMLMGVFLPGPGLKYFIADDGPGGDYTGGEVGTYTWDPVSHVMVSTPTGGNPDSGTTTAALSRDELGLSVVISETDGDVFTIDLERIVSPSTVLPAITNLPSAATGEKDSAFSFTITATNTLSFSATGLPAGLTINPDTGVIAGTPTVGGSFSVVVTALNTFGDVDQRTLTLTIAIPTPTGQNVTVEPEVPDGLGEVSITFGEVTEAGNTTVTVIDPEDAPELPGNIDLAGIIYNVETEATFEGLITLCFSYAGVDFGGAEPRLFHYELGNWVDVTTSVDRDNEIICGATTTLSPFVIFVSHVVRTGFYAPLNPIAGFLNSVKGGTTVPLKFDVHVNGIEQTTTEGLTFTVQPVACDTAAPLDDVEAATTSGGTNLRYDTGAGHFIQNWKVPKTPGACYMARVTTAEDGLALTARFKVR